MAAAQQLEAERKRIMTEMKQAEVRKKFEGLIPRT